MRIRKEPDKRKQEILEAAIGQAHHSGYDKMTRDQVAERCGVSRGLITPHYFPTMDDLRSAVMAEAVARGILGIVMQGIAARDEIALSAPDHIKEQVAGLFLL